MDRNLGFLRDAVNQAVVLARTRLQGGIPALRRAKLPC
jgi:hypothetical protein